VDLEFMELECKIIYGDDVSHLIKKKGSTRNAEFVAYLLLYGSHISKRIQFKDLNVTLDLLHRIFSPFLIQAVLKPRTVRVVDLR
jgi:hypothetical protein